MEKATVENSMAVPLKMELPCGPAVLLWTYTPGGKEISVSKKYLPCSVHCGIFHSSQCGNNLSYQQMNRSRNCGTYTQAISSHKKGNPGIFDSGGDLRVCSAK